MNPVFTGFLLFCYHKVMNQDKDKILHFISAQHLCVLSTINQEGLSESAVIGFGETENFELIFGTDVNSRKYTNLKHNSRVSVVIGWVDGKTVQYEGIAKELLNDDIRKYSSIYFTKSPSAEKYSSDPNERYFIISPTWIRYTDISNEPWEENIL
jgi:pyridoxine/pyridoxamine 5'-phosphate oxidase